jgi:hypothetical protein
MGGLADQKAGEADMEIEMVALAALLIIAIIVAAHAVKLRRDVWHGPLYPAWF